MSKVYPFGDVDGILQDVESEMDAMNSHNDNLIRQIYDESNVDKRLYDDQTYDDRSRMQENLQSRNEEKSQLMRSLSDDNIVREDVKLSCQMVPDNTVVADELRSKFTALLEQIQEFKSLNEAANEKLKHSDAKIVEMENKIDELEEEIANLQNSAAANDNNNNNNRNPMGLANINFAAINPAKQSQLNQDISKRSEQLRKALLSGDNDDEVRDVDLTDLRISKNFFKTLKDLVVKLFPFKRDVHQIQARFGASVASYFMFQRFVFLKISFIALCMVVFSIYHITHLSKRESTLSGYISGEGYLPKFMLFSSFHTGEKFVYAMVVIVTMLGLIIFLCVQMVNEHKTAITVEAIEAENVAPYSKEVLCAWDFSLQEELDIDEYRGKHDHVYLQLIEDSHETGQKKHRSNFEAFVVYSRRVLGTLLYLSVVGASFTGIIAITVYGTRIEKQASSVNGLQNVGPFIGPLALTMINGAVPTLLKLITKIEAWDSAQRELMLLLFRVYLSSTLNTIILTLSYILLVDPFLLTQYPSVRRALQLPIDDTFQCRVDQAANGMFTLVGGTWFIQLVSFGASPYGMKLVTQHILGKPWTKTEFNAAESMVKKFSFLGLVFVSFPFAPLSIMFVPVYMFITFKVEKYFLKHLYAKPKRPFRGQQAALLYSVFYLATYLLVGVSVSSYFVTTKTLAKSCDIQDVYVELCSTSIDTSNLCTTDTSSEYYAFWGTSNYPATICESRCGPFVHLRSGQAALKDALVGTSDIGRGFWRALFEHPYVPWFGLISLAVFFAMRVNSSEVFKLTAFNRDRAFETKIHASEAERKRQEKIIQKLKTIEEEEEEEDDDDDEDD